MTMQASYLNTLGILCALGSGTDQVRQGLRQGKPAMTYSADGSKSAVGRTGGNHSVDSGDGVDEKTLSEGVRNQYGVDRALPLGLYQGELPDIPLAGKQWQSRNNRFAYAVYQQIETQVQDAIAQYGAHRVAVIIGTSTSGISDSEDAICQCVDSGIVPDHYDYKMQEMGATADFIAKVAGVNGPVFGISTACSSGAKALASARRLISAGLCDVAIVGGVDTLCKLTVQGFSSLEAVSDQLCNPFSGNRQGINIGEGAALFLVSKKPEGVELKGVGEGSDAHHISAPDPSGAGAVRCMMAAIADAGLSADQVDYVNLHGTATALNDQMEAIAMAEVCGSKTYCSSTKPYTGHTLGAAGAVEAGICWLILADQQAWLPQHLWDGHQDTELPEINLVPAEPRLAQPVQYALSNSFAFGGNNIALLLGRINEI